MVKVTRPLRLKRLGVMVAMVVLPAATVACGGSSTSTGSSSSTPVKVMAIVTVGTPILSFPEANDSIKGRAAAQNANGGLNGHPIQIVTCNDQMDPNQAATCARQAAADSSIVAVVGDATTDGQILPILQQAGIAYIDHPFILPDFQNPDSFTDTGAAPLEAAGLGQYMAQSGCKNIGIASISSAGEAAYTNAIVSGASLGGAKTTSMNMSSISADVSPVVESGVSKGIDCVALAIPFNVTPKFLTALHQLNPNVRIGGSSDYFFAALLAQLGSLSEGMLYCGATYPLNGDNPTIKQAISEMKSINPSDPIDAPALLQWGGLQMLIKAMAGKGSNVTRQTVRDALGSIDSVDLGFEAAFGTKSPGPIVQAPRLWDTSVIYGTLHNGTVQLSGTWVNIGPSIANMSLG